MNPNGYKQMTMNGKWVVDIYKMGVDESQLADTRLLAILEGHDEPPLTLQEMVNQTRRSADIRHPEQHTGRVRETVEAQTEAISPPPGLEPIPSSAETAPSVHDSVSQPELEPSQQTESMRTAESEIYEDARSQATEIFVAQLRLREISQKLSVDDPFPGNLGLRMREHVMDPHAREVFTVLTWPEGCPSPSDDHGSSSSSSYPVEREARPLTDLETKQYGKEFRESHIKELQSWLDKDTCYPQLIIEYVKETHLKPLPSRWVTEFKIKEGRRVVKGRLCIKGFAERNQGSLHTSSPSASRLGHRLVMLLSATHAWDLLSLDTSTAFLQGYSFDYLDDIGFKRQPVSFLPPASVWQLLAELCPEKSSHCLKDPAAYCLRLRKAAYGLKSGTYGSQHTSRGCNSRSRLMMDASSCHTTPRRRLICSSHCTWTTHWSRVHLRGYSG